MGEDLCSQDFKVEDWERIIRALLSEARQLNEDSKRAYSSGASSYGAVLLEEAQILYDMASTIELKLP